MAQYKQKNANISVSMLLNSKLCINYIQIQNGTI